MAKKQTPLVDKEKIEQSHTEGTFPFNIRQAIIKSDVWGGSRNFDDHFTDDLLLELLKIFELDTPTPDHDWKPDSIPGGHPPDHEDQEDKRTALGKHLDAMKEHVLKKPGDKGYLDAFKEIDDYTFLRKTVEDSGEPKEVEGGDRELNNFYNEVKVAYQTGDMDRLYEKVGDLLSGDDSLSVGDGAHEVVSVGYSEDSGTLVKALALRFNRAFPKYPPLVTTDRWLYGVWILGNDYRNKTKYYGTYPPQYVKRIKSMFNGVSADNILHLFSGAVQEEGVKIDINPDLNPDVVGNAEELSKHFPEDRFELVLADPPYSKQDAEKYGYKLPFKRKVLHEIAKVIKPKGILVWLDTILPQYTKKEFKLIGTIAVIRSTNHRVRLVSIFEREDE